MCIACSYMFDFRPILRVSFLQLAGLETLLCLAVKTLQVQYQFNQGLTVSSQISIKLLTLVDLYKRCLNLNFFFNLKSRSQAMEVQTFGYKDNCSFSNSFQMSVDSSICKLILMFEVSKYLYKKYRGFCKATF